MTSSVRFSSCSEQSNTHGVMVSALSLAKCAEESVKPVSWPVMSRSALTMIPVNYPSDFLLNKRKTETSQENSVLQMK